MYYFAITAIVYKSYFQIFLVNYMDALSAEYQCRYELLTFYLPAVFCIVI